MLLEVEIQGFLDCTSSQLAGHRPAGCLGSSFPFGCHHLSLLKHSSKMISSNENNSSRALRVQWARHHVPGSINIVT